MRILKISTSLLTLLIGTSGLADAQDKAAIEKKLTATYALTQPTADNTEIVTAGAILVLQSSSHLCMAAAADKNLFQSTYKDGKITADKKSTLSHGTGFGLGRLSAAGCPGREYVRGEKMWVTKIEVREDGAYLDLFTDAVNDVRFRAILKFQFPKGIALTPDQVDKMVAEVFKVQPSEDSNTSQQQAPPGGQRGAAPAARGAQPPPAQAAPAPIQAPPPPIEAPPPPVEAPPPPIDAPPPPPQEPKVIKMGEAKTQVVADFGQPQRIAQGAAGKEIYFYKDIKVTFTAGKVTNIE